MRRRKTLADSESKTEEERPINGSADTSETSDESWEILRCHVDNIPALSQLSRTTRDELVRWLQRTRPFPSLLELQVQLGKARIEELKAPHQKAVADSLRIGLTRRPFLAALGLSSLASLGVGVSSMAAGDPEDSVRGTYSIRPLIVAILQQQRTVGQTTRNLVEQQTISRGAELSESSDWRQFLHALDMSNWMEAAIFLKDSTFQKKLEKVSAGLVLSTLYQALRNLQRAWEYLEATQSQWEENYFVGYAFGKMPTLATATPTQPVYPRYDAKAEEHAAGIHDMAPLFRDLEVMNQLFQKPGETNSHAPIRFTQGHNFSYAHVAPDLQNREIFRGNHRTILVNWDAHADLSDPFENPRIPIDDAFVSLQKASTAAEKVVISSSMSIAGWILPLIYQGLLQSDGHDAQVVWVVPKEAQSTSHNYMAPYGKYSFLVGDWQLPATVDEISEFSTTVASDWNQPGSTEIRRFSENSTLTSVTSPDVLNNQKRCDLHIVDPDNVEELNTLMEGAQIALSVDADYAGTREPGLSPREGFLPHYPLTGSAEKRARHEQLIQQLAQFYRRHEQQIRTVTIANSPNFTVDEETRKPVAKILKILVGENLASQPAWVADELNRAAPQPSGSHFGPLNLALSAGGILGLTVVASLLSRDWRRLHKIRSLLLGKEDAAE